MMIPWWAPFGSSPKGAIIEGDGKYRLLLWRVFDDYVRPMVFCMLNPSTADANTDDATIRRCCGFARREKAGGLIVVNLSPWRATDPRDLERAYKDGLDVEYEQRNRLAILAAIDIGSPFVLAWGGGIRPWMEDTAMWTRGKLGDRALCLGKTQKGDPRHPLMLAANTPLEAYYRYPSRKSLATSEPT
jgi:hypothetical protein